MTSLRAVATAVPDYPIPTEAIWTALSKLRRPHAAPVATPTAGCRYLAEPLEHLLRPHSISERTASYLTHARRLGYEAASAALNGSRVDRARIGMIVYASCTGFVLPSLDAELSPRLGLRADTVRLPIAELGCGAGVAALARAHDFVSAAPDRAALVVAVELPSLTFQPEDRSTDNLIAALVFGDGAGAAVIAGGAPERGWSIVRTGTMLVPEGASDLGYELRDGGLTVVLSRRLPEVVQRALAPIVVDFLASDGLRIADLHLVAAHPGGPRIFRAVEAALGVAADRLTVSSDTFTAFANASSAGIFFVLEALPQPTHPMTVLAIGFGPGLSIELALLRFEP
jgi:alkylresorcinol/alkylpyrone synthase